MKKALLLIVLLSGITGFAMAAQVHHPDHKTVRHHHKHHHPKHKPVHHPVHH